MPAAQDKKALSDNATPKRIIVAARKAIAARGIARFTHRAVAAQGKIPLASLTYHFESKEDLIDRVSMTTLFEYIADFDALRLRLRAGSHDRSTFARLTSSIVAGATAEYHEGTTAWLELILHGGRNADAAARARRWFGVLLEIWTEIAEICGFDCPEEVAQSAIDETNGLMLMAIGLAVQKDNVLNALRDGADPVEAWSISLPGAHSLPEPVNRTARANARATQTRQLIIDAAMQCFVEEGLQNVGYRTIAQRSGLSESAPYYYFPKIADLLREAQSALFDHSKKRFRSVLGGAAISDPDGLADLTAAILQSEVTQFALHNLANFSFWLEAGRDHDLVPIVRAAVLDQHKAWVRRLTQAGLQPRPLDALQMQAQFAGLCLRLVATGSAMADIADARRQIRLALQRLEGERG